MSTYIRELGEIADFVNGYAFKPSQWESEGKRIIRIQNLTDPSKPYNQTTADIPKKYHVHQGDLLVSWSATLGVFEWKNEDTALVNQHIFKVALNENKVDRKYLRYAIKRSIESMSKYTHGSTMKHINRSEFLSTKVRIPLLDEQRRIAAILDKADAIRRKRHRAIQLADEFLRSVFLDMFGDPVLNPKNWKIYSIERVVKKIAPGWSVKGENKKRQPNDWGVLKVSAVTSGRFFPEECKVVQASEIKKSMVKPKRGDLLFSRANTKELVAATCLVEHNHQRLFLPDKIWKIVPDRSFITSEYLRFVLSSQRFRDKIRKRATGTSGSMLNVSQAKVKQMNLPVPPLQLQDRFSGILWKTYKVKNHAEKIVAAASKLFNSLSQRAFRGEL